MEDELPLLLDILPDLVAAGIYSCNLKLWKFFRPSKVEKQLTGSENHKRSKHKIAEIPWDLKLDKVGRFEKIINSFTTMNGNN